MRRLVGYVSQQTAVDPDATGRENLSASGPTVWHVNGEAATSNASTKSWRVSTCPTRAGRLVKTYSGGMKRKLDVAMGLVHQPRVLFLDEPTTGLDPEARADMWREIRRLTAELGITILLTTHYLEEADQLANRVAIIDRGRIVVEGTPEQLKQELHGDTIQVELGVRAREGRPRRPCEGSVRRRPRGQVEGHEVRARVGNGATILPPDVRARYAGLRITSVTVARPSLDDVYLRYAGRSFAAAHEEGSR